MVKDIIEKISGKMVHEVRYFLGIPYYWEFYSEKHIKFALNTLAYNHIWERTYKSWIDKHWSREVIEDGVVNLDDPVKNKELGRFAGYYKTSKILNKKQ